MAVVIGAASFGLSFGMPAGSSTRCYGKAENRVLKRVGENFSNMKKTFAILVCATFLFSKINSAQDLATRLAQNQCFIKLVDNFEIALTMPNKNFSLNGISASDFNEIEDKDGYLVNLTRLPLQTIKNVNQSIKDCVPNIKETFPELDNMTNVELETAFSSAINLTQRAAGGEIGGGEGTDPCADCRRNGRIGMLAGIFFGIRSCLGNLFTMWGCGTLGFYIAAQNALACLRANNCL